MADDQASREVWLGNDGALAAAAPGTILVESSTVTVEWIQELKSAAQARGCELLDAPVTGSRPQAAAGELLFLCRRIRSGARQNRAGAQTMSREIVYLGPTGSGARMKLINNFMCGVQAASLAEALSMIEQSGLDVRKAMNILRKSVAPGCRVVKTLTPMLEQDYQPNFLLKLMAKDLRYAAQEAKRLSLSLATGESALQVFSTQSRPGWAKAISPRWWSNFEGMNIKQEIK